MHRGAALLFLAVLSSCGGGGGGGDGGPATAGEFSAALVDAVGAKNAQCGPMTTAASRFMLSMQVLPRLVAEAERAGRMGYDPAKGKECLQLIAGSTCAELAVEAGQELAAPCEDAFVPKVPVGGGCTALVDTNVTGECIGGTCQLNTDGACTDTQGTCVARGGLGDACGWHVAACARGYKCGSSGFCVARAPVIFQSHAGDRCDGLQEEGRLCEDALRCVGLRGAATCEARAEAGDACGAGGDCVLGTSCDGVTCTAWKRVGDSCVAGNDECEDGAFCDHGSCAPWPGKTGTCGTPVGEDYRDCLDPEAWCNLAVGAVTGTCQSSLAAPQTCDPDQTAALQCGPYAICSSGGICTPVVCWPGGKGPKTPGGGKDPKV
jgi:hypothetical protein